MKSRGFTMLELMIILTIISALTAIAVPNLIRAKMAANEAACIAIIKTFGTSEELYRRVDWDGNGTKEYAQNMGPNGGNGNSESLFYNVTKNTVTGLLDGSLNLAEIPKSGSYTNTTPRSGYIFFVQLGASYPNVLSYIDSKNCMTLGYGICAVPYMYSLGGIATYQMSNTGVIYARDQGTNTLVAAYNVNPSNGWFVSQ